MPRKRPPCSATTHGSRRGYSCLPRSSSGWCTWTPVSRVEGRTRVGEKSMQGYLAALTIVLLLGMVLTRVILMRRTGTRAMHFGRIDRTDFLIPPFALFYFYAVFAAAFGLPSVSTQRFFHSEAISWVGVFACGAGLTILFLSLVSFGRSFRVGIDVEHPDKL